MNQLLLVICTMIGGVVQGVSGMGYAIVVMSLMTPFMPYIPLVLSGKLMSFIFFIPVLFHLKKIHWKLLIVPVLFSFVGVQIGLEVLTVADEKMLKLLFGTILVLFSIFNIFTSKNISFKPTPLKGALAGIISGFCSSTSSMSGPPMVIYYINIDKLYKDNNAYYATITTTFQLIAIEQLLLFYKSDAIPKETWNIALLALIPTIVGALIGRKWASKVNVEFIKKAIYIFMLVMGGYLIITNINRIFTT